MQQALDLPVTPRYGFETFIPCQGNSAALEFARRVADSGQAEKLVYLYGSAGCGKTHLLHAIGRSVDTRNYRVVSCRQLTVPLEIHHACLLVDDLDCLPDSPSLRQGLWESFNHYYNAGKPVALAGTVAPQELTNLDEHLTSRLLWGLVARLDVSDDASRLMLIAKLAADHQVLLPEEVAIWLLAVLPRDVGSLVKACDDLYRTALQQQRRISMRLAKELFNPRL